jgi:hypothetical protein
MGKVIPMNDNGAEKRSTRRPLLNQAVLCGRLVADPRVRVKADGLHVSEFRMVTNDRQAPEFHDVVTHPRLAELVGEYTRKGSLVQPANRSLDGPRRRPAAAAGGDRGVGAVPEPGAAGGGVLMTEQPGSASYRSGCQLMDHVEEVRQRQTEVMRRLLPWLIADPLLVEALELMSLAVTELIDHHDGLHEDVLLLRVIES